MSRTWSFFLILAVLAITTSSASTPFNSRILTRDSKIKKEYDYVIVGGGTSGLTVADRLTEDGKCKLLDG